MSDTLLSTSILKFQKKWTGYIGLFFLLLFTITVFSARGLNRVIEVLFLLSILFSLKPICTYEKENKGLWIYILIVISLILIFISNAIATAIYPSLDVKHNSDSLDFVRMLFFVFVGWWVVKQPKIVWLLLAFLALAFVARVIFNDHFLLISNLQRLDFGFSNAQHAAAFSGSLLIACISLGPIILKVKSYYLRAFTTVLTLTTLAITLIATLTSQTRAIWLGLFLVLGIAIMPWLILAIGEKNSRIKLKFSILLAGSLIALITFGSLNPTIYSKVKYTTDRLMQYSQMELKDIPVTSIGIRLHQWNLALDLIEERPISGHGGGSAKYLIQASYIPQGAIESFGHFHNSYLELGVAHGLGATFTFIFILGFLLYRIIKAYKNNDIGPEFFFWGTSWIVFFSIINIFESYVGSRTGYVLLLIFGGIIYGITSKPYNNAENQQEKIDIAIKSST